MKDNVLNILKKLGFSDKEAHFYITALSLGTFSLSSIAHASGLKRPTCYLIAENLLARNLLSEVPSSKKQRYQAQSLNVMIEGLQEQKVLAERAEEMINKMEAVRDDSNPRVEIYTGEKQIQNILKLLLQSGEKDFYFVGSTQQLSFIMGEGFTVYIANMIEQQKIRSHIIHTDHAFDYMPTELREVFYAPKTVAIKDGVLVFGNRVVIFSQEQSPYAVLFESASLSATMRALWETVKSVSQFVAGTHE